MTKEEKFQSLAKELENLSASSMLIESPEHKKMLDEYNKLAKELYGDVAGPFPTQS